MSLTTIDMPTDPPAPQSVEWVINDIVAQSISPFTGGMQVLDWQNGWLEASISMPPLTQVQAQAWIAFLMKCRGIAQPFLFGDPLATKPAGAAGVSGGGTPQVNGSGQATYVLATKGWTHGVTGMLLPGDWMQIGSRLYRVLDQVDTDSSGNASINIWPRLRESPPDGTVIILTNTKGAFRLKSNTRKWSETQARYYGLQFEIREALC